MIAIRTTTRTQPKPGAQVAWDSPLAELLGLGLVWSGHEPWRVHLNPPVMGRGEQGAASQNGPAVVGADSGGARQALNYTSGSSQATDLGAMPEFSAITYGVISREASVNNFSLSSRVSSADRGFQFLVGPGGASGLVAARIQTTVGAVSTGSISGLNNGRMNRHVASWVEDGALRYWAEGVTASTTLAGGTLPSSQNLYIARHGSVYYTGSVSLVFVGNRGIDDGLGTYLSQSDELWSIFRPQQRRTYFIPAAAPPGGFIAAWARNSNTVIQVVA